MLLLMKISLYVVNNDDFFLNVVIYDIMYLNYWSRDVTHLMTSSSRAVLNVTCCNEEKFFCHMLQLMTSLSHVLIKELVTCCS